MVWKVGTWDKMRLLATVDLHKEGSKGFMLLHDQGKNQYVIRESK